MFKRKRLHDIRALCNDLNMEYIMVYNYSHTIIIKYNIRTFINKRRLFEIKQQLYCDIVY